MQISVKIEENTSRKPAFTDVVYESDKLIGRGELAAVFEGTGFNNDKQDDEKVVVKVPHTVAKSAGVQTEYNVLDTIAKKLEEPSFTLPVPEVSLGKISTESGELEVMVMPYFDSTDLLITKVRGLVRQGSLDMLIQAERIAVDAAIRFAETMDALHCTDITLNNISKRYTCTDRKIKDFYLIGNRYLCIDWNVLRDFTPEFSVGAIRLFGYLWHELFLESKGESPFEPFYDVRWVRSDALKDSDAQRGTMSVGLRVLLARAVDFPMIPGIEADYSRLAQALRLWRHILDSSYASRAEIEDLFRLFNPLDVQPDSKEVEAVLADLEWRRGDKSANARDEIVANARTGDRLAQEMIEQMERDPSAMEPLFEERQRKALDDKRIIDWQHLERWKHLARILSSAYNSALDSRQQQNLERQVLTIGRLLHQLPKDDNPADLREATATLNELAAIFAEVKIADVAPLVNAIRKEIELRQRARDLQDFQRLGSRLDALRNLSIPEKHYTQEYPESESSVDFATAPTLYNHIVEYSVLERLIQNARDLEAEPTKHHRLYEDYTLLLALAAENGEVEWIKQKVNPLLELYRFTRDFQEPEEPYADWLRRMLYSAGTLVQSSNAPTDDFDINIAGIVRPLVERYVDRTIDMVKNVFRTVDGKVQTTWTDIEHVGAAVDALDANKDDLSKKFNIEAVDKSEVLRGYRLVRNYYKEWFNTVEKFRNSPQSGYKSLFEFYDKRVNLGVNMPDLISADLLNEHRQQIEDILKSQLQEQIGNLQQDARNIARALEQTESEVQRAATDLQQKLDEIYHSLSSNLTSELNKLEQNNRQIQFMQAIEEMNINAAYEFVVKTTNANEREQYNFLRTLAADKELENAVVTLNTSLNLQGGTLQRLRALRDMLRTNKLPQDSQAVYRFFTNPTVINLAKENPILRDITNLYWLTRTNDMFQQSQGHENTLTDIISGLASQANTLGRQFNTLQTTFTSGNVDEAYQQLNTMIHDQQKSGAASSLTAVMLNQLSALWHERIAIAQNMMEELMELQRRVQSLKPPRESKKVNDWLNHLNTILNLLNNHVDVLDACPPGAFHKGLYERWAGNFDTLKKKFNDLNAPDTMSGLSKADQKYFETQWQSCAQNFEERVMSVIDDARAKQEQHNILHKQN